MFFEYRAFSVAKDEEKPATNQDAFAVDCQRGIAAVGDGVSATLYAGRWARSLVESIVDNPPDVHEPNSLNGWLTQQRQAWSGSIDEATLAWHQKPKLREGAAATLLWIELEYDPSVGNVSSAYQLRSYAVGDTCLFHIRNGRVMRAFPIEESRLFDATPKIVRSISKTTDGVLEIDTLEDVCLPGDVLVLCTDAVAEWALGQLEAGRALDWESQWCLTEDEWRRQVRNLRQTNQIRYDDSTVVMLRIASSARVTEEKPSEADWLDSVKKSVKKGLQGLQDLLDDNASR